VHNVRSSEAALIGAISGLLLCGLIELVVVDDKDDTSKRGSRGRGDSPGIAREI
jgi:hypothetical protein